MKTSLCVIVPLAPRRWRPRILSLVPGFEVHPTSSIGRSFICPSTSLRIGPNAIVGHLTVIRQLDRVELGPHSAIGNFNSIGGWPVGRPRDPYPTTPDRVSELVLEERAVITSRHYVECSDSVRLAEGGLVAGVRTVILTHGLNVASGEQRCRPVRIGRCSLVNTSCVIVGGSALPDYSVLAPFSLLRQAYKHTHRLYAGNPATDVRPIDPDAGLFQLLSTIRSPFTL